MMLADALKGRRVVLASRSPRRRELLAGCDIAFEVADYETDESYPSGLPLEEVPLHIARAKADAYPGTLADADILITADTAVIAGGGILGKPVAREEALRMLALLSGAKHVVVTGVVLRSAEGSREFSVATEVVFAPVTPEAAAYYVDRYRPYDKAGAYGIQEWIGLTSIESVCGSYYNVMGLPTERLCAELAGLVYQK